MRPERVDSFWKWFVEQQAALAVDQVEAGLLEDLDERVRDLGDFDWEIGPGKKQRCFLALSPRGDREGLAHTREVMSRAPSVAGWEFYAAKPPRDWSLVFTMERRGEELSIDATAWEFVAYLFKDGTFDVLLKPPATPLLSEEEAQCAAIVIVDGELGEATRLELVGSIEVVKEWDAKARAAARKLEVGLLARALGAERH